MRLSFFVLFLLLGSFISAQNINSWLKDHQTAPFQKLYIHTDRELYFSGDTIWFAAYLVEADSHTPTNQSCNLYIDLVDNTGKIVQHELFLIQNGFSQGWIPLENSAGEIGNLMLRAYTDYLKNYGNEAFQRKSIQVSQVKNSLQLQKAEHLFKTTQKIDVSFFPEGGFLLNGEPCGVAFKVIDENGTGIPVSGTLYDEMKKPVLTFKTTYKGAGKFYFYPEAGKTYSAKINGFDGFEFRLPDVQASGAKIMLVNQDSYKLQLIIQTKDVKGKFPLNLVCMHRGKGIFSLEVTQRDVNKILKIDAAKLKGGINRLVLLDKNLTPLSERLIFNEEAAINQLQVRLNEETFSTRDNVQVNIKDTTTSEISFLSVAVVDENYVPAGGVSQNIASCLLLDSELNGYIESPADYFVSDDSLSSQIKLDLLMSTNGWSNYIWNNLEIGSVKIEHQPQFGFSFEGQVKRAIGNKALPEGGVSLILFKNDSATQFFDQPLEPGGKFRFNNIFFTDSASVFVQARNKRNRNSVQFNMKLPDFSPIAVDTSYLKILFDTTKIPFSVYRNRYLNEMKLKAFRPEKNNILMDEIEVTAQKPEPKIKTGTPRKNNGAYRLTWEMTAGSFDIVEYLAYKVPGISKIRTEENELYLKLTPSRMTGIASFFVDGYRYITYDEARSYNINDFKTIEIISPPMSYAYGAHGIWGAINLTFKTGDEIALDRPLLGGVVEKIKGFAPFREFYSPKYTPENLTSEVPDFRNTLYWNPNIVLASDQSEVYFFTSDNISRYKIFVEGISENGTICLGNADFSVDKYQDLTKNSVPANNHETDILAQETLTNTENTNKKPEQPLLKVSTAKSKNPGPDFITGKVQDKFGGPVEFATLFNSTQQKSCITNALGEFQLEAEPGDSVKIQHLNYKTNAYRIEKKEELFILSEKDFKIEEVLVSPKFAFELFDKSCKNTWKSFKDENISRAYCRCTKKENGQTALVADFDLDIVQKKRKNYQRGEHVVPFKIQERKDVYINTGNNNYLFYLKLFYPYIQQIYWVDLPDQFIYSKQEDENTIRLSLSNKSTYDHTCNIEVTIDKNDTILLSFAMVRKNIPLPFVTSKNIAGKNRLVDDTLKVEKTYHFLKYSYNAGFGYLSEYIQGAVVRESEQSGNLYEISEHLKTYENGAGNMNKRPNRRRIFDNSVDFQKTNNRFTEEFWMKTVFPQTINFNFQKLSGGVTAFDINE